MTPKYDDFVTKSSYKIGLTVISILLATICILLTIVFSTAYGTTSKNMEIEIKLEKHISTYESMKDILTEIKTNQKEQCVKLEEQSHILLLQGQKLDEFSKKLTNHCIVTDTVSSK